MDVEKRKKFPEKFKLDKEEIRRYMFPCAPKEPWLEEKFIKALDGSRINSESELFHVLCVSNQLTNSVRKECYYGSSKYRFKCDIEIGKPLDVKSLLFPSRKGCLVRRGLIVDAKNLKLSGKYVMLCCFMVPLNWNSIAWKVAVACHDLYSKMKNRFEMVIVAIMRDGWTHDKKAFSQFMSAFPSSCLAIPFHAKSHRRRVCKYLGGMFMANMTLVNPAGNVLLHNEVHQSMDIEFVPWYHLANSHAFPFITDADAGLHLTTPSSLEDLLYCRISDFVFRKNPSGSEAFWKEKRPISQLKSKLVGLYLYTSGNLLPWLRKIEEACRQSDKELDIVVVYLPDWDRQDPRWYPEFFSTVLAKQNISWWVAPYNNTASIILKHLFEGEKVIIVGPNGSYLDTYGAELMQLYGITGYPFTVKHVAQKTLAELSKVTLESFLDLLNMSLEHHHIGKNILFYFDYPLSNNSVVYDAYTRFTSDVDAVILPCSIADATVVTEPEGDDSKQARGKLSWHNPCIAVNTVVEKFFTRFFNRRFPTIVAFGKDGRICSLLAHRLPYSHGDKSFPIKGDLLEEVSSILTDYLDRYYDDELRYYPDMLYLEELQELRQSWV
ncbi:probable nucleoredoxin 1 [Chenopodium quinoa]|uniref:Uncharacterized protein n=1 Tax=Chenopodium quinoa TaxID=63459 RepID=A0A803LK14_CHEQI|nr:probable nucleoredoxin 1 [Chenopodium quinoa]XP_021759706.1 probable nucleoredoxin 1 [Chenopodium quinoa]